MKLNRKVWAGLVCAGLAFVTAGCSGINATGSVSPATFLLPGLVQSPAPPAAPAADPLPAESPMQLARK